MSLLHRSLYPMGRQGHDPCLVDCLFLVLHNRFGNCQRAWAARCRHQLRPARRPPPVRVCLQHLICKSDPLQFVFHRSRVVAQAYANDAGPSLTCAESGSRGDENISPHLLPTTLQEYPICSQILELGFACGCQSCRYHLDFHQHFS